MFFCDVSQGSISRERFTSQFTTHGVWKGEKHHMFYSILHLSAVSVYFCLSLTDSAGCEGYHC